MLNYLPPSVVTEKGRIYHMGLDDKIRQPVAALTFDPLNLLISYYVTVKGS